MSATKEYLDLIANKRKSLRTDNFTVLAKISTDIKIWTDISVSDISSGGLLFRSDRLFEKGETVWFDLLVKPMALISRSPRRIRVQGEVLHSRGIRGNMSFFAAKFEKMTPSSEAELDTLIQRVYEKYGSVHDTKY